MVYGIWYIVYGIWSHPSHLSQTSVLVRQPPPSAAMTLPPRCSSAAAAAPCPLTLVKRLRANTSCCSWWGLGITSWHFSLFRDAVFPSLIGIIKGTVRIDHTVGVFACLSITAGCLSVGYVDKSRSVDDQRQFLRHVDLFKDVLYRRGVLSIRLMIDESYLEDRKHISK